MGTPTCTLSPMRKVCLGYLISQGYLRCLLHHWDPEMKFLITLPHVLLSPSLPSWVVRPKHLLSAQCCKVISCKEVTSYQDTIIRTTLSLAFLGGQWFFFFFSQVSIQSGLFILFFHQA